MRRWIKTVRWPWSNSGKMLRDWGGECQALLTHCIVQLGCCSLQLRIHLVGWRNTWSILSVPLSYVEKAELGNAGGSSSSIIGNEDNEVVKQLLGDRVPEFPKTLDVIMLYWLTCLCDGMCWFGTVPPNWQTEVVVPIFKDIWGCAPVIGGSHSSASFERSTQKYWRGEPMC